MIWLALTATLTTAAGASIQEGAVPYGADLYAPPPVRPFEAPPGLGAGPAEGDAADLSRAPLTAPVDIDAYRHSYETSPTDSTLAYDQGVDQAEISMDARMGPLDGRWRVRDAADAELMVLILVDRGDGAVEGAWRSGGDDGLIPRTPLAGSDVTLQLGDGDALHLARTAAGWTGALTTDGVTRPVTAAQD
jgi:hypothetical protein